MRIKILLALIVFSLVAPIAVSAAGFELAPEFNTLCWKLDDCNEGRASILKVDPTTLKGNKEGWIENEDPCNKSGWGKCLPVGKTKTTISFGGKKEFNDIGEFIKYNYNLALSIAGILAVIMMIVAGIQWVTSGGNSEMISSAKKRIGGSLIGLLIAYLSYTILNTVNPALVNLRLPTVWMIRAINTIPEFCRDTPESTQFAFAAEKGQAVDPAKMKDSSIKFEDKKPSDMKCGQQFFVSGGGGATCKGSFCADKGYTCLPFTIDGEKITAQANCEPYQLAVHFAIEPSFENLLNEKVTDAKLATDHWLGLTGLVDNPHVVWPVCSLKSGGHYIGDVRVAGFGEEWDSTENGTESSLFEKKIEKSPFYEYYILFNHLASSTQTTAAWPEDHWGCRAGDHMEGYVIKFEFDANWSIIDPNFYVSQKKIGKWVSISDNGFISNKELQNGTYIEAKMSASILENLFSNKTTSPSKLHEDGSESGAYVFSSGETGAGTSPEDGGSGTGGSTDYSSSASDADSNPSVDGQ